MNEESKTVDKTTKIWGIVREIIEMVVVVLILVIIIRNFVGETRWIPTASMRPTLMEGDKLIVEKVTSYFTTPHRGDILVFYPPTTQLNQTVWGKFTRLIGFFNTDTAYIKRVIGTPGDRLEIKSGAGVFINGKLIKEPYINGGPDTINCSTGLLCGPITIPKNEYFMMGDNRNNSQDSRYWGFLPKNRVIGKAFFRFWPLNRMGLLNHPDYNVK